VNFCRQARSGTILGAVLLLSAAAHAQSIVGQVKTAGGSPVQGVLVTATRASPFQQVTDTTDAAGNYALATLALVTYSVVPSKFGCTFSPATNNVTTVLLANTTANFTLVSGPPPSSSTLAASAITPTNAQLNGSANPNGVAASAYFQYGLTTSYGSVTAISALGNGNSSVAVAQVVSSLLNGTNYHFRLVASNSLGTAYGEDATFSTLSGIPSVTTLSPSGAGPTTMTLNGSVNPNGVNATGWFEWGLTTNYGSSTVTQSLGSGISPMAFSQTLTGLVMAATYHYRAVGATALGTNHGVDAAFTPLYPLSGWVTDGTSGVSGVTVTAGASVTTTDPNGFYFFTNLTGTLVVTPSQSGQVFNPAHQALSLTPALTNINFTRGISNITTVVATCDDPSLEAAVAIGGWVMFGCDGVISLTNQLNVVTNLVLDGTNHLVTLDGGGRTRVALVVSNALTLANLTVANGVGPYQTTIIGVPAFYGGGIFNWRGSVGIYGCTFISNTCLAIGSATSNAPGCFGGAICSFFGSVDVRNSTFVSNTCSGGPIITSNSPGCFGGAIYCDGGTLAATTSSFLANSAFGNTAFGGAIFDGGFSATGSISGCLFKGNSCVTDSTWSYPDAGSALGGAIFMESAGATNSNSTTSLSMVNCTFGSNTVRDLNTDNGASLGNAIASIGSGVFGTNYLNLIHCTFKDNTTGSNEFQVCVNSLTSVAAVRACIFEDATPAGWSYEVPTPLTSWGSLTDLGFNLGSNLQYNNQTVFTNSTSHSGVNTMLAPSVAMNGGPTATFALLPGSAAIDAVTNGGYPATDQRGFSRAHGFAADSGAVEYYPGIFSITSVNHTNTNWQIQGNGLPLTAYRLQSSSNLANWFDLQTNLTTANGMFNSSDPTGSNQPARFYRTASP